VDLITPSNLSIMWNWGFVLGIIMVLQVVRGIFLSFHYHSSSGFERTIYIIRELQFGWGFRYFHITGASVLFFIIYLHIFRGFYFSRFKLKAVWWRGVVIFLLIVLTAFFGYVLPWAQIRFWAATVITNLASSIPFIGDKIVISLWGGFSIRVVTLTRFFSFHFLLPIVILALIGLHILLLHLPHSQNPLFAKGEGISFHSNFSWKDLITFGFVLSVFLFVSVYTPFLFSETDAFVEADPLSTPEHIVPEWYFLPFYAVLRAVPRKLEGFLALLLVFWFIIGISFSSREKVASFSPTVRFIIWLLLSLWFSLFWVGRKTVVFPFDEVGSLLVGCFILVGGLILLHFS